MWRVLEMASGQVRPAGSSEPMGSWPIIGFGGGAPAWPGGWEAARPFG